MYIKQSDIMLSDIMLNSRNYLVTLTIFVKIKVYIYPVG